MYTVGESAKNRGVPFGSIAFLNELAVLLEAYSFASLEHAGERKEERFYRRFGQPFKKPELEGIEVQTWKNKRVRHERR
jgi:hypothetical protein